MEELLHKYFGYTQFRPLQREIIEGVMNKKDSFVLMPTGGGKSLCFQLPALMLPGLTVVVSPLIALMKDQVDGLIASGVPAAFINSSLFQSDIDERMRAIKRGKIKLLYVAPERLVMPSFLAFLAEIPISLFAIDEAHCISEWGHDFRSEYRQLRILRKNFPDVPVMAMTATATQRVQQDILEQLKFGKTALRYKASFDRANLHYAVLPKEKQFVRLLQFLKGHKDEAGIIYCFSKKSTDALAAALCEKGFKALPYHAGLDAATRTKNQEKFVKDEIDIICATIAFGMGIDKSNVRFVVHYDLPKSIAGYYQETGRAGRDGLESDCLLFFSYGDKHKIEYFFTEIQNERELRVAQEELKSMLDYAESHSCRRKILLNYFGEHYPKENCGNCDNCMSRGASETIDATREAQMFLSCVARIDQRFGIKYVIDVLRGSEDQRILSNRHHDLSTYGIGKDKKVKYWQALAHELISNKYLVQDAANYNVLRLTPAAWEVMKGERKVEIRRIDETAGGSDSVASSRPSAQAAELPSGHKDLFEKLRALRKNIAEKHGMAPYMIFHDSSLRDMTVRLPKTKSEFLEVLGVGESKADKYGKLFLEEIAAYQREHSITKLNLPKASYIPPPESQTTLASFRLYKQGMSAADISSERKISLTSVMAHLEVYIASKEITDISAFVSEQKIAPIKAAFEKYGDAVLSPVMDALGKDGFTYEELRVVRAFLFAGRS
ncbi:MAG: DNA helicase RecQ [Bacteroidota bacterium]|nr:DNA helicase RecQ [Bacteroidota bacterium]MDP4231636.1 DNA helicase RecQ [Bacteroidota bacterium]MDP4236005.1 DNA helicase RecQ [Bacteroidota bacterium]